MAKVIFADSTHRATIIRDDANQTEFRLSPFNYKPSANEVREIIGGWFERIKVRHPDTKKFVYLYVNEEGVLQRLPYNSEASRIANMNIQGNVVMFEGWQGPTV